MQGRTGKIVLVVLGVILMIVFILPSGLQSMGGSNATIGTIDGQPVRWRDVENSAALFDYATRNMLVPAGQGQYQSLATIIFAEQHKPLSEDLELFHLLLIEAQQTGSVMPREPLEQLLLRADVQIVVPDRSAPDGQRTVAFEDIAGEELREMALAAAGAVMSVNRSLEHYAGFPHISTPFVDYFIATQAQRVDLRTVVFDARAYMDRAAPPSQEAMQAHFEKYKQELEGAASAENPFGFGYRLPDRVKFQYIMIPADALRQHVTASLTGTPVVDREQTLYAFWGQNRALFASPATAPATQPVTQPSTQPSQDTDATPPPAEVPSDVGDAGQTAPGGDEPANPPPDDAPDQQTLLLQDAAPEGQTAQSQVEPATQPSTAPATQPSTQPTTSTAPFDSVLLAEQNPGVRQFLDDQTARIAGRPTEADWKAYVEVHDKVVSQYVDSQAGELQQKISKRLREMVGGDYRAFDVARTSEGRPRTRAGVPYDDPQYLERASDIIATEFGVRPRVASYGRDYLTREQLSNEDVVGTIGGAIWLERFVRFDDYLFAVTLDLLEGEARALAERGAGALRLMEPSQPLYDMQGNEYVFRVTDARTDEAPASLAAAEQKVREDLTKLAAYEIALAEAREFAELARRTSLEAAAEASGRKVHDPAPFAPGAAVRDPRALPEPAALGAGPGEQLSTAARADFVDSVYEMLTDSSLAEAQRPISVLPMRPGFRAIVAELQDLVAGWGNEQMLGLQREQLRQQLLQESMGMASPAREFYNFDKVAARVGYLRETPRRSAAETEEQAQSP